jgi:DNA-binding response OmpR family regulator
MNAWPDTGEMHILVIEDDPRLADLLGQLLAAERHVVEVAATGRDGLDLAAVGVDAIVLDIGLPDMSGLDVARRIRAQGNAVPILMLTARDAVGDRVMGLDAGADDYLVKPFAFEELAARLRSITRRPVSAPASVLTCGPLSLDDVHRIVTVDGRPVELSQREFALLEALMRHPNQVLTRDQLLDHAWPIGVAVTPNSVDAYVVFLRRKLGPAVARRIETVRGVGFRLRRDDPDAVERGPAIPAGAGAPDA